MSVLDIKYLKMKTYVKSAWEFGERCKLSQWGPGRSPWKPTHLLMWLVQINVNSWKFPSKAPSLRSQGGGERAEPPALDDFYDFST